jgi:exonuclease III
MVENKESIDTLFKFSEFFADLRDYTPEKAVETVVHSIIADQIKIISWNYDWRKNYLITEKINLLRQINPDILIIQECTYYECIYFKIFYKYVNWYGDGKDSMLGIGVLAKEFEPHTINMNIHDQKFRYVIPYEINIHGVNFLFLAVWTKNILKCGDDKDDIHCLSYLENIFEAINFYDELLQKYTNVVIIGDFNSYDKKQNRNKKHIELKNKLKQYDIYNCTASPGYKYSRKQYFETEATYYHNYNPDNAGTDDYCFLKKSENIKLNKIGIGHPEKWIQYSNHFPLYIQFSVKNHNNAK